MKRTVETNRIRNALAAVLVAFVSTVAAQAQERVSVKVFRETTVSTDRVSLKDVAGFDVSQANSKLASISLGYAPAIGSSRQITCDQIRLSIAAAGLSESEASLYCTAPVVIRRSGQSVPIQAIKDAVSEAVGKSISDPSVEAKIVKLDVPEGLQVPVGELRVEADVSSVRNIFLPFTIPVRLRVDGRVVRTLVVSAEVEAYGCVFVAGRDVNAASSVTSSDFRLEKVRLTKPASQYVTKADQLAGTASTRELRAGTELTVDALAKVNVIQAGDTVTIEGVAGQMKLSVAGEARASGRIGDRIAVKNVQSGALLQGVVVGRGRVRVTL